MDNPRRTSKKPCVYTRNNLVYKVNEEFIELSGYKDIYLIGKSIVDLGILLKAEEQISIQDIEDMLHIYIFTNRGLPVGVKLSFHILDNEDHRIYYFEEIVDPALEFIFNNFDSSPTDEGESVAIFTYPDCLLLKHDENYIHTLSTMNISQDNPLGKYPLFPKHLLNLFKRGISFHEFEMEFRNSNGIVTHWDINVKLVSGNRNNKYLLSFFYNTTGRVIERKLLEKERNEMKLILENMPETINIIDKDGKYTYINKIGREKLSPYISKDILDRNQMSSEKAYNSFGKNGMKDINGKILTFEEIPDQRVLRGETLINYTVIGTEGPSTTHHECDGIPIYDERGNIDGGILIYRDIEDYYRVEEYKVSQKFIKNISIYYTSFSHKDFKINYMNDYAFQIFKEENPDVNTLLDIIGRSFFDFYRAKDTEDLIDNINKAVENKSSYIHEYEFANDGKIIYTKSIFQPIFDKNDQVVRIISLGLDISDERMSNKKMEDIIKAQEEMLINTSHELKTPLNTIFSSAQLLNLFLEKDFPNDIKEDISYCNKIIIENCYRLTKLINNILDISKIESGLYNLNLSNYNVVEVLDDIILSLANYNKSKNIKIIFDTEVEEEIIALDLLMFNRALLNLVSNAIKFSHIDGLILLRLMRVDDKTLGISVTDNGIGIQEEDLSGIFQKFAQVNKKLNRISEGTGIGLSLVKSIAELHGGSLRVESTYGKGSTFTIELPIRTIRDKSVNQVKHNGDNRIEMIKYELSDIY